MLARNCSIEEYGQFAASFSLCQLFVLISGLGQDQLVQARASASTNRRTICSTALKIRLCASLAGSLSFLATSIWLIQARTLSTSFLLTLFVFLQFADILGSIAISAEGAGAYIRRKLLISLIFGLAKPTVSVVWGTTTSYSTVLCLEQAVTWLVFFGQSRTLFSHPFRLPYFVLLRDGFRLAIAQTVVLAYSRLDGIILVRYLGAESAGAFLAITRLSEASAFLPQSALGATFALRSAIFHKSRVEARDLHVLSGRQLFTINAAIGAVAWAFGEDIIAATLGNKYSSQSSILALGLMSNAFVGLGLLKDQWLLIDSRIGQIGKANVVTLAVNLAALGFLVPSMGLIGAAFSALRRNL
jgi:O-antigen/teichoic acid export membrane protein